MCLTVTKDGMFASRDVRYKKESSGSSVSSGSSYQRYVDSMEDKDTDTPDSAGTVEYSDQNSDKEGDEENSVPEVEASPGSIERELSAISIGSSVLTRGASDLSSLRRSIGRGSLLERLRRSSSIRPGSVA